MDPTMATIVMFASNFAPSNWAFCNGQLLSISQNSALFALIGTIYGGNGQTTFGLPDLRSRTPVGAGSGAGLNITQGETSGSTQVTLLSTNLPTHAHTGTLTVGVNSQNANTEEPDGANPAVGLTVYSPNSGNLGALGGLSVTIGNSGGNSPVSIAQPYIGVNFIICLYGIFPSRP